MPKSKLLIQQTFGGFHVSQTMTDNGGKYKCFNLERQSPEGKQITY